VGGPLVKLAGWRIVAMVTALLGLMTAAIVLGAGTGEPGIRMLIRATARTSVALFVVAFTASALYRLRPSPATAWARRNRRYLGVSFAVSHFLHLAVVAVLFTRWPHPYPAVKGIGGAIGYLLLAAMTATSFDRTANWLGPRRWKQLHTIGSWYLWGVFLFSYIPRAVADPVTYVPLAVFVMIAATARLSARRVSVLQPVA
jgi:methionine sulfoxide reductase heme-binding subunit